MRTMAVVVLFLNVLLGSAATLVHAAASPSARQDQSQPAPGGNEKLALAILPFRSLSANDEAAKISNDAATRLWVKLNSNPQYSVSDPVDVADAIKTISGATSVIPDRKGSRIGRLLSVSLVISGTYQIVGKMLRLDARFIDVSTGLPIPGKVLTVTGEYPGGFFDLMDKLATSIDQSLNSRGSPASSPPFNSVTPLLRSPSLGYKRTAPGASDPAPVKSQSFVTLKNISPYDADFEFRSTDGQSVLSQRVTARSSMDVHMPTNSDFTLTVTSRGGRKSLRCRFEDGFSTLLTYDAQVGLLTFTNNTRAQINVKVSGGGTSIGLSLDPGQTETLRVPAGQFSVAASADNFANQLQRTVTLHVGDEVTTKYEAQ